MYTALPPTEPASIASPETIARRAFDLAMAKDWKLFELELMISRERFLSLNERFEPEANAEKSYAQMLDKLRQGFDKVPANAKKWLGIEETTSKVKNGLAISKVYVIWETTSGEPYTEDFTMIALDGRLYVVDLD